MEILNKLNYVMKNLNYEHAKYLDSIHIFMLLFTNVEKVFHEIIIFNNSNSFLFFIEYK